MLISLAALQPPQALFHTDSFRHTANLFYRFTWDEEDLLSKMKKTATTTTTAAQQLTGGGKDKAADRGGGDSVASNNGGLTSPSASDGSGGSECKGEDKEKSGGSPSVGAADFAQFDADELMDLIERLR